jgi:probable HAF family extracellular repeat protein
MNSDPRINGASLRLGRWQRAIGMIAVLLGNMLGAIEVCGQTRQYIVTELSSDDATRVSCKLNNHGDIVGRAESPVHHSQRATVWSSSNLKSKHLRALVGADYSSALDINDDGEIVGGANTDAAMAPFMWNAKGDLSRIPLLPGDSCGQAIAINKHGHVVGYSSGDNGVRAFLWMRKTATLNLGVLPGGTQSLARDVNDSDEVVGTSGSSNGDRAVLWTKSGNVLDLGTLVGDWASEATAINNKGEVVGYSKGAQGMRAFIWSRDGGMQELGILPDGNSSRAMDINDRGEVVGSSTSAMGEKAFIWTKQSGIVDLNSPASVFHGFNFIEGQAINSRGQIIVLGRSAHESMMMATDSGAQGAEICSPAPPSSFLLTPLLLP